MREVDGRAIGVADDGYAFSLGIEAEQRIRLIPYFPHTWRAVAASDTIAVAVGDRGQVAIGERGGVWRFGVVSGIPDLNDVVYSQYLERWYAVGNSSNSGIIFQSIDGEEWLPIRTTRNELSGIATDGEGTAIVCGSGGKLFKYNPKSGWHLLETGTDLALHAIEHTFLGWVAAGEEGVVLYSEDAVAWTQASAFEAVGDVGWITDGNGVVLLVNQRGSLVAVSEDLANWRRVNDRRASGLVFDGAQFVHPVAGLSSAGGYWNQWIETGLDTYWDYSMSAGVFFGDRLIFVGSNRIIESGVYDDAYDDWAHDSFEGSGVGEQEFGESADPDGDGLSNVLEYCFGLNPAETDRVQDVIGFARERWGAPARGVSVVTFPRPLPVDASVVCEWSLDLKNWSRIGGIYSSVGSTPGGQLGIEVGYPDVQDRIYVRLRGVRAER